MNLPNILLDKLKSANRILFFTGAGISAESGVDTFRGKGGLWNKMKPEELASFDGFMRNPNLVWEWYQYRRKVVRNTTPNPGHRAIAEFEKYFDTIDVITQNVDNLHRRAGSKNILELHGNIERNYCMECGKYYGVEEFLNSEEVPKCPECGGMIRPDVVWFGENLPDGIYETAVQRAQFSDVCFVVGTSAVVYPAAYIPTRAKEAGSFVVEINLEGTDISGSLDLSFQGKSGEILPEILAAVKEIREN
ncbi:MAG: NAD-dependent deacylase [Chlorobi bacterium]|nr:NAD-dependent deacylase [Chlorobiota bacterium]